MAEEVEYIKEKLTEKTSKTIANCTFYRGYINETEIILLQSGIGKVNAAIGTTLLCKLYEPDYVINTGSAGGLNEQLQIGDIVISTEVRYHDVDATVFDYEYGQVPQMPASYQPDATLMDIAKRAATKVGVQAVEGLIISGDSFMSDEQRVQQIKKIFTDPYCAEMEAGAIAQVCYQFQVPFVIIRSLSDIAGKEAAISFETFLKKAAIHSAKQVLFMIEKLQ